MKKILLGLLLMLAPILRAQNSTIVASNIGDVGGNLTTGTWCVTPAQPFVRGGGGNVVPTQVCYAVTAGVLQSGVVLPDTSLTNPAHVCYRVLVRNQYQESILQQACMQPTGSTYSYDNFVQASPPYINSSFTVPQFSFNGTPLPSTINIIGSGVSYSANTLTFNAGSGGTWPGYPGAGVACSTSTAWCTSYGTSNKIPADFVDLSLYLTSAIAASTYQPLLGFTPYNATNPAGYITSSSLSPYLLSATAASTYQLALGFTPYNSTNPASYITASSLSPYLLSATAASAYEPVLGDPSTNGYVLSSTTAGLRSWIPNGTGGSMVYPGAGVACSTSTGWCTSYTVGTAANDLVQLNASGYLPALNASLLTDYAYANLTGVPTIPTSANWPNAGACTTGQYVTTLTNGAVSTCAQVAYSQVSGTPAAYTLPTATSTVLGGVKPDNASILNGAGVLSATPASIGADVSGAAATAQTNAETYAANAGNLSSGTVAAARLPTALANSSSVNGTPIPASVTLADLTSVQTLTNKTLDGVTPAAMAFVDPTSSIQTQINGKQASLGYTPLNPANNLSDVTAATARTNLGLGSLAVLSAVPVAPLTTSTASTAVTVSGNTGYYFNDYGALTYNLPTITSGLVGAQYCFRNYTGITGILTVQLPASTYIDRNGAIGTVAGHLSSAGALGDAACVVAISTTRYAAYVQSGTWVNP